MDERKYRFNWDLIGDIDQGRPNLGTMISVEQYRLMQFTIRDVLEAELGREKADELFYEAGYVSGKHFYNQYIGNPETLEEFVSKSQQALKDKGIGVLRIEEADMGGKRVLLTVDEDLDCSGLPETDFEICVYDEGFISALFECFTGAKWLAKEIDCWCTGARTCRFEVKQN